MRRTAAREIDISPEMGRCLLFPSAHVGAVCCTEGMTPASAAALGTIVCLLIATIGLSMFIRRQRAKTEVALRDAEAARLNELEVARIAHQREVDALNSTQVALRTEHTAALEREAARTEVLRRRVAQGEKWEAASRASILRACGHLNLDAIVATNVMFLHEEDGKEPFVTQLDHVVLTERGCLVIENKGWAGVVIESIQPHDVHPALGVLVATVRNEEDPPLTPPFTIQFATTRPDEKHDAPLSIRIHTAGSAPAKQVRNQAWRLSQMLKNQELEAPFFVPCVFYSNPGAEVHAAKQPMTKATTTHIIAGHAELRRTLDVLLNPRRATAVSRQAINEIAAKLHELGADIRATGHFRADQRAVS